MPCRPTGDAHAALQRSPVDRRLHNRCRKKHHLSKDTRVATDEVEDTPKAVHKVSQAVQCCLQPKSVINLLPPCNFPAKDEEVKLAACHVEATGTGLAVALFHLSLVHQAAVACHHPAAALACMGRLMQAAACLLKQLAAELLQDPLWCCKPADAAGGMHTEMEALPAFLTCNCPGIAEKPLATAMRSMHPRQPNVMALEQGHPI